MSIDRHNYEEYFLLYVDNELTVDQKRQVELFVKENPDLEAELLMLEQSKLIPDASIHFNKKEMLMKEEIDSFISMNDYQAWLVLYVDNELSEEQKIAVEKFAAVHPQIQQELELFQRTKLAPERIVFDHKEVLFRKERATLISMYWWRVAVAAILIVAAGITMYSILNNRNINGANTGDLTVTHQQAIDANKQGRNTVRKGVNDNRNNETPSASSNEQMTALTPVKEQTHNNKPKKQDGQNNVINPEQLATNKLASLRIATPGDRVQTETQVSNVTVASNTIHKEVFVDTTVTKPTVYSPDVYKTPEIDMPVASGEHKKLRGFFRKTTRIIVRNTADNDNKLLIGGMAFNVR